MQAPLEGLPCPLETLDEGGEELLLSGGSPEGIEDRGKRLVVPPIALRKTEVASDLRPIARL